MPIVACIKNLELWLAPPPDSTDTLELEYSRSGAETTSDDFSWLPELERFRVCDFAVGQAFESLHMYDVADRFMSRWATDLAGAVHSDARRKWKGKRLQATDVFQEFNAMNYQASRNR